MRLRPEASSILTAKENHMAKKTAQLTVAEYQALITGIPKYLPNGTFMVSGQTLTATQAVTFLQGLHDTSAATIAAKGALQQARDQDVVSEAQNGVVAREIRDTIALMFSNAAGTLAAFGLTPRKPPKPLSPEARVAANAKAKATRAARGTKGKVQKAAIVGNVTGVTITPVVAPTAQPAAVASTPPSSAASSAPAVTVPTGTPSHS
jgi:hypothetical protein